MDPSNNVLDQQADASQEDAVMRELNEVTINSPELAPDPKPSDENEVPDELQDMNSQDDDANIPDDNDQEPNTSMTLHPPSSSEKQFATPLKLLPPLKDIESITTPKSFSVAKDSQPIDVGSSPVVHHKGSQLEDLVETHEDAFDQTANDTFASVWPQSSEPKNSADLEAASSFVGVEPSALLSSGEGFVSKLAQRAHQFQGVQSELSFFKLNQEQINQVQQKKFDSLYKKLEKLSTANTTLTTENEKLSADIQNKDETIADLRKQTSSFSDKVYRLEQVVKESESSHMMSVGTKDQEMYSLNDQISKLTKSNIELSQRLSELTKELNNVTNEKFVNKLELSKASNELTYVKKQKDWYEKELLSIQDKYTELIKKHDSEYLKHSSKISSLVTQNEGLASLKESLSAQVKELETTLEKQRSRVFDLENILEVQNLKLTKEATAKDDMIELLNVQLNERNDRIAQLEDYSENLKMSTAESISGLQSDIGDRDERIISLEEQLRRTEEALDNELHKETELPKLASSAEMILQGNNLGISLSSLYTEFNHIKKELILERSQKEKLATQLQHFVTELESKKPAIANYRNQILFYETQMKGLLGTLESVRLDKVESEKESIRLRTRLASYETELQSIKQLSKDLGRQLCYYLIHSKIRDGDQDPLSSQEKRVIEQIMTRSNGKDTTMETDTDQLITERLVGFASIIELQQKNEELLSTVRLLGKQLEEKDQDSNGLENAAVEEAREAILTLQSELESVTIKLEAVTKERDLIKSLNGNIHNGERGKADAQPLLRNNDELKQKVEQLETSLKTLQTQSGEKIRTLSDKLEQVSNAKEDLQLKEASAKHSVELAESRLENAKKLLENLHKEIEHTRKDALFWKDQATKQEDLLVRKSNELRDAERNLVLETASSKNLMTEKEVWESLKQSLRSEIEQIKADKEHLKSFVFDLQSILKEREASSLDLSKKLTQSIENYQALQTKISEKEERILILSSQSDMALRAQNAKLEQVNELSQKLLEAKNKLAEKQALIESLRSRVPSIPKPLHKEVFSTVDSENNRTVLASEYEDLKNEYKVAEAQVAEFSNIAKAAEDALMKATESFDLHKISTDEKLKQLESEKEQLTEELERYKASTSTLEKLLEEKETLYLNEVQDLKTKAHQFSLKAGSYDELKQDYESKLATIKSDLDSQITHNDELEQRIQQRSAESELYIQQLATQKDVNAQLREEVKKLSAELESVKTELASKEAVLAELMEGQNEELEAAKIKIRDLEYQYNLAINQIELSRVSTEAEVDESSENLREVVGYLRREKDAAESRLSVLIDEQSRLKTQIETLSAELGASKSHVLRLQTVKMELNDASKEHSRLLEQLEQLNILRESNSALRHENKVSLDQVKQLQTEIESLRARPLSTSGSAEVDEVQVQELNLLKEENERLKTQLTSNEEVKNLLQRFENLKNEFKTKLMGHRNKNKELEKELGEIKASYDAVKKELEDTRVTGDASNELASLKELFSKLQSDKSEAEKKFSEEIENMRNDFEKQRAAAKATFDAQLSAALANASKGSETSDVRQQLENEYKVKLEQANKEFNQRLRQELESNVEQEIKKRISLGEIATSSKGEEQLRKELERQYEAKLKLVEKLLHEEGDERVQRAKAEVEKAVDKKYEFKLRVLNRKVEKLEKEHGSLPKKPNKSSGPTESNKWQKGQDDNNANTNKGNNGDSNSKKRAATNTTAEVHFKRTKE